MEQIVADASVLVKLFVNETYSDRVQVMKEAFVKGEINLNEPFLMPYEVMNAVRYSPARFTAAEQKAIAKSLANYGFTFHDTTAELAEKTIDIAGSGGLSIYDAVYVALALLMRAKLYTADEELIKKANSSQVRHIREFNKREREIPHSSEVG
jgi:predicted nucleic acid-binding protein